MVFYSDGYKTGRLNLEEWRVRLPSTVNLTAPLDPVVSSNLFSAN